MKPQIKFSERYWKLAIIDFPTTAILHKALLVNLEDLAQEFIEMDTRFYLANGLTGHYTLPAKGKYLALGFGDGELRGLKPPPALLVERQHKNPEESKWDFHLFRIFGRDVDFSTLRRWTPEKSAYYQGLVGKQLDVVFP
jgi:hypothetical protein